MATTQVQAQPQIQMKARVFRIAWDRRPFWIPKGVWLWLGKKRVPGTGRWEDHGVVAKSEDGTLRVEQARP